MKTENREYRVRNGDAEKLFDACLDAILGRNITVMEKIQQRPEAPVAVTEEKKDCEQETQIFFSEEDEATEEAPEEVTQSIFSDEEDEEPEEEHRQRKKKKYKGFMRITCEHCGKTKSFCAKTPISQYICNDCGEVTQLVEEAMRPLYMHCECGGNFAYTTNSIEGEFDMECLNCGMPVAVGWNKKKKCYEPYNEFLY